MIATRILFNRVDVDQPAASVTRRWGPADEVWDVHVLNGRARRFETQAAGPFSIKWMAGGRARYALERRPHIVSRDTLVLVDQSQPYDMEFEARGGAESFCVFFRERLVREAWASHEAGFAPEIRDTPLRGFPNIPFRPSTRLAALLADLAATGPEAGEAIEEQMLGVLDAAIAVASRHRRLVQRAPAARAATRAHLLRLLERARGHIIDRDGVGVDLAALAREAGLSRFHLLRLFKSVYGLTPMAFAERVRINQAAKALRETDRPIGEIAAAAGYASPSAFAKAFRRCRGAAPTAART